MNLFRRLLQRSKQNNRGFSLVEVLSAVAILSLVSVTVSVIVVVSTRTYKNGMNETALQQEAQLATNQIADLIRGANDVVYTETTPGGDSDLVITIDDTTGYKISYNSTADTLNYEQLSVDGSGNFVNSSGAVYNLAENVLAFSADTSDFVTTRTVKISLSVRQDDKEYSANYTMTARNEEVHNIPESTTVPFEDIGYEAGLVLEPGQSYKMFIDHLNSGGLELTYDAGLSGPAELTANNHELTIQVERNVIASKLYIHWKSKGTAISSNDSGKKPIEVSIRRANSITVSHLVDRSGSQNGSMGSRGTKITFNAIVNASNAKRVIGTDWDDGADYKNPKAVVWKVAVVRNKPDGTAETVNPALYLKEETATTDEDSDTPHVTYELVNDLTNDMEIRVTAISKHQMGKYTKTDGTVVITNKSAERYCAIKSGVADLYPYNEDIFGTDIMQIVDAVGDEIVLEPLEPGKVPFNFTLAPTDVVTCKARYVDGGAVKPGSGASFSREGDKQYINITVGKDERGQYYGYNESQKRDVYDYDFYVDVFINNKTIPASTIIVHVCRVDSVSIGVDYNPYDHPGTENATLMSEISYHFKTRFNTGDGVKNDEAMKYLVADRNKCRRAMAVKYEWQFLGDDGVLVDNKCILFYSESDGEVAEVYTIYGRKMTSDEIKAMRETPYYKITDLGCAKWDDVTGTVSSPQLKIHLKNETKKNPWPSNARIYFKSTAMHPAGAAFSFNGAADFPGYSDTPVCAEVTIFLRNAELGAPEITVVEPNQGTDDKNAVNNQARMNLSVGHSAVYKIVTEGKDEVTLSGASDPTTRTARYNKTNNIPGTDFNPNKVENANSNQNDMGLDAEWTWRLGIIVGKDEHGKNGKGLIQVDSLISLDTKLKQVSRVKHDVYFAIRRVDALTLKASDGATNIDKLNKVGQAVTLVARPTGCDGIKYYDKQEEETDYKSPYEMLWTLSAGGRTYDLNQRQVNEYIDVNSIKIETVAAEGKQILTFTLKKELPKGAELRATSLHAKGMYNSVPFNKSGIGYGNIYDRIVISGDGPNEYHIDESTFFRGSPYNFLANGFKGVDADKLKQDYTDKYKMMYPNCKLELNYYFRFREVGGTWTQYFKCMHSGTTWYMDELESQLFLPDKEYEIEYVAVLTDTSGAVMPGNYIIWPQNDYLTNQAGIHTGFERFVFVPDFSLYFNKTKMSEFCFRFTLGCSGVEFKENSALSVAEGSSNAGSKQYPIVVNSDFEFKLTGIYLNFGEKSGETKYKDALTTIIEKKVGDNWVAVDYNNTPYAPAQMDNANFSFRYKSSSMDAGTYRIATVLNSTFFKVLNTSSYYPVTDTVQSHVKEAPRTQYMLSYPNYDIGYIYLKKN